MACSHTRSHFSARTPTLTPNPGRLGSLATAALLLAAAANTASAQSITGLGFLPGGSSSSVIGLSADGSTAVGYCTVGSNDRAFRWRAGPTPAGTLEDLSVLSGGTYAYAWACSADGSVVVGYSGGGASPDQAFRWTSAGMTGIGALLNGAASYGNGVSADGSVIVGQSGSSSGNRAFRWTSAGMTDLGVVVGTSSSANAVSGDGNVVVGLSGQSSTGRAFRWTSATNMQNLGLLPAGTSSWAFGTNGDGSIIVGFSRVGGRERAFKWTGTSLPGTFQDLGAFAGGNPASLSIAYSCSADGSVVVGRATSSFESRGFIWTTAGGFQDLYAYLSNLGINMAEWQIQDGSAVSADGRTIVGNGMHNGNFEPYIARLTPASHACNIADICGIGGPPSAPDGLLTGDDFNAFINAFGAGDTLADICGIGGPPAPPDGLVTGDDFNAFIAAFANGCP